MKKSAASFTCLNCGRSLGQWAGRCPNCGEWNSIVEQALDPEIPTDSQPATLVTLDKLPSNYSRRIKTALPEFDLVLGSDDPGLVVGSLVLLVGSPGVGKSSLLLQAIGQIDQAVYFSAEESLEQLAIRAKRLGGIAGGLKFSSERDVHKIIVALSQTAPSVAVIDSIQTVYDSHLPSPPGSLVQIRECCWRLARLAKSQAITILIVGHITKEGVAAGPKTLEHLVDVVLYLEGEARTGLRLLRSQKNRFGSTDEVGVWQMTAGGFKEVADAGRLFANLVSGPAPGRALTMAVEGNRPFLVEIQVLAAKTTFGYPKRLSQGLELNRLNLLLAVAETRLKLPLDRFDIYLNVVGGFQIRDPGVDLAIVAGILSALNNIPLADRSVWLGEVGLLGEVRTPTFIERRRKEAKRLGYQPLDLPKSIVEIGGPTKRPVKGQSG